MRYLQLFVVEYYNSQFICRKLGLWWTAEDSKKVPSWIKLLYILCATYKIVFLTNTVVYLGGHTASIPVKVLLNDTALCLSGLFGFCMYLLSSYKRQRTSILLKVINDINRDILERNHNANHNLRLSNRLFLILAIFSVLLGVTGLLVCPQFVIAFAKTGVPYFRDGIAYEPFSIWAYTSQFMQLFVITRTMSLCTGYFAIHMEILLRISFYFRVTAEEIKQLRRGSSFDEGEELMKLKRLIKDANSYYW